VRGNYILVLSFVLLSFFALNSQGQRPIGGKPIPCTNHPANRGAYKILSISLGEELQFYVQIKPRYRTDENYIAVAKEFKEAYCHEDQLRIIYYANKRNWMIVDPKNLEATPLAIFCTTKKTSGKEGISVYMITNGKVEIRKLDLTL